MHPKFQNFTLTLLMCFPFLFTSAQINTAPEILSSHQKIGAEKKYSLELDQESDLTIIPIEKVLISSTHPKNNFLISIYGINKQNNVIYPSIIDNGINSVERQGNDFLFSNKIIPYSIVFNEPLETVEFDLSKSKDDVTLQLGDIHYFDAKTEYPTFPFECALNHAAFIIDDSKSMEKEDIIKLKSYIEEVIDRNEKLTHISLASLNKENIFFTFDRNTFNVHDVDMYFFNNNQTRITNWNEGLSSLHALNKSFKINYLHVIADGFNKTGGLLSSSQTLNKSISEIKPYANFFYYLELEKTAVNDVVLNKIFDSQIINDLHLRSVSFHEPNCSNNQNIILHPNPFSNEFTVTFAETIEGVNASFNVYNASGSRINPQIETLDNGAIIDLSTHTKGIYIIEVYLDNKLYTVTKAIKL